MFSKLNKQLFKIARSDYAAYFIGFVFARLSFLIPVKKIVDETSVLSFPHPKKYWDNHFLVVPKKRVPNLLSLNLQEVDDRQLVQQIFSVAVATASALQLPEYSILVNGGRFQDVPQLHFHVAAGRDVDGGELDSAEVNINEGTQSPTFSANGWDAYVAESDETNLRVTFIGRSELDLSQDAKALSNVFQLIQTFVMEKQFTGFAVSTHINARLPMLSVFNLVATND